MMSDFWEFRVVKFKEHLRDYDAVDDAGYLTKDWKGLAWAGFFG